MTSSKTIQTNLLNQITLWIWNLFFVIIFIILGIKVVENSIKNPRISKKKHLKNYIWNLIAALIGGFALLGIYYWNVSGPINELISIFGLIVLFVGIMVWRNKYLKA